MENPRQKKPGGLEGLLQLLAIKVRADLRELKCWRPRCQLKDLYREQAFPAVLGAGCRPNVPH